MITQTHKCHRCSSTNLVKNGTNASGSQRYKCKDCGVCRVLTPKHKTAHLDKDAVLRTFEERNSYRSTGRIFQISHTTVFNWLKKSQKFSTIQDDCARGKA